MRTSNSTQPVAGTGTAGTAATRHWRALLLLLLVAVSILALTPKPPVAVTLGWDKLNHMAAFTALAFVAYRSVRVSLGRLLLLSGALLAFGGLIEVLQFFVPGRSCEWADLFADSIGIACGVAIAACALWTARRMPKEDR